MEFVSKYVAKPPDEQGLVNYSDEENAIWQRLYQRQSKLIPNRACDEFIQGLDLLGLNDKAIPQLPNVNQHLSKLTGWQVEPVAALISAREFFTLLAKKRFPAATFIRCEEEFNYIQEPDIFHELFGHCPMLTNPVFADFMTEYAQKVLQFDEKDWPLLQRFFWFTVEFGLIKAKGGLRIYGGGILSSGEESVYAVESDIPLRALFEPLVIFRTPYRIDMLQKIYFVIDDYQQLYDFVCRDIDTIIKKAREQGEFPPFFPKELGNPSVHMMAC